MARSCQPTYVADQDDVIHVEEAFDGRSQSSLTRCGLQLSIGEGTAKARFFHLGYPHLFFSGCQECRDV